MQFLFCFVLLGAVCQGLLHALSINKELNDEWVTFKRKYGKMYEDMEELAARITWEWNLKYIQDHNLRYDLGQHSYYLGVNEFADMSNEEFRSKYTGLARRTNTSNTNTFIPPFNVNSYPKCVDWRTSKCVTPVKNQAQCGSCWAFSTTGSVESQYCLRKKRKLVSLSEQQLVDCSNKFGNNGCNGGLMDNAFRYIEKYGLESEMDYPYTAMGGICKYNAMKVVTKVSSYRDIEHGNEDDLEKAVATVGPVSVAIDASHTSFQFYKGGVYDEPQCSSISLDHGVLAVGYGVFNAGNPCANAGIKYWLVKNSWTAKWGLSGYIMMSKDNNNQCGIASAASYPIM